MYVVAVRFEIEPEHAEAFLARVQRQAADSLEREPGCRRFDVAVDPAASNVVFLYELYDDPAAFDAHKASDHYADFTAMAGPMTRSKRVEFFTLVATR